MLLHDQARQAVGEAPALVTARFVKANRCGYRLRGERYNLDVRILMATAIAFRCRAARSNCRQCIHPFPQNRFRCDEAGILPNQVAAPCSRPSVVLVRLVGESNPERGVGEISRWCVQATLFGAPYR